MRRLAIMRPQDKLEESERLATAYGFVPICASPLKVVVNDSPELREFLECLDRREVDMVVLTSSTGVESLMSILERAGTRAQHTSNLQAITMVAIGPITAEAMVKAGIEPHIVPTTYSSEGLVDQLNKEKVRGMRIVLLRSDHGEPVLRKGLEDKGAVVTDIAIYKLVPTTTSPALDHLIDESLAGRVDAFAFTSSLSAKTFIDAAEGRRPGLISDVLRRSVVAAMGQPTRRKLEEMGVRVDIVPENATFEDILRTIAKLGPDN